MIYPSFLKKGNTIGICAPSAGVGRKLESFDQSLSVLKESGFNIKETEHVRINDTRGGTAKQRGNELNELFKDSSIDFVMCAAGGDFLNEMIPYIDFDLLKKNPKFIMGHSDPTGILYPYTTLCDVATIYGANAGEYDLTPLPQHSKNNLKIIQGNLLIQKDYPEYQKALPWDVEGFVPDTKVKWNATQKEIHVSGRCIGGCIDGLKDLIGTRFDRTKDFIDRYQNDGFIWYFDNFALSAENLYRTLMQMKYASWFTNAKAIIIGRTLLESSDTGMEYDWTATHFIDDVPVIYDADIGHTMPHMTMINGALLNLHYKDHHASLEFKLQ